eukprot:TRINITY_DN12913_c0_g1_i2.p1 TRINITY_DN12913_c0_g1~~TRINITY_DN12913_c0_g1_i2.p1  ORF type:complete len:120 (+),score=13.21 TRINITY_DN12913_c0_g1_i2:60-419(+)
MCIRDSSREMTKMLELTLLAYTGGSMVTDWVTFGQFEQPSGLIFLAACIIWCLPATAINEVIFPLKEEPPDDIRYSEVRNFFETDYDRENPATKEDALREHQRFLFQARTFKRIREASP